MKFSSKIDRCQLSPIRKFAPYARAAEKAGKKIYSLNIGNPDIATPSAYKEALRSYDAATVGYGPSEGLEVYLNAVMSYYDVKLGVKLEKGEVIATTGGSEALCIAANALLDEGDEIICPEPFYPNYSTFVTIPGGRICPMPTTPENGYRYAVREHVEACINEHTKAILVTNPGNPTGCVLTEEEMRIMLDVAKEHDLFLVCDEVYREFVYDGSPLRSALQYEGYDQNLIIVDSVSKRFSACGARVGVLISKNMEFMHHAMKWCQARLCPPTVDQIAAAALYTVDEHYFEMVREEYKRRRDTMVSRLQAIPGVQCKMPDGAFYLMATLPVDDADKFQMWLLTEFEGDATVMFASGEPFYATPGKGKNEVRLAYVINCDAINGAMDVLERALREYNNK